MVFQVFSGRSSKFSPCVTTPFVLFSTRHHAVRSRDGGGAPALGTKQRGGGGTCAGWRGTGAGCRDAAPGQERGAPGHPRVEHRAAPLP